MSGERERERESGPRVKYRRCCVIETVKFYHSRGPLCIFDPKWKKERGGEKGDNYSTGFSTRWCWRNKKCVGTSVKHPFFLIKFSTLTKGKKSLWLPNFLTLIVCLFLSKLLLVREAPSSVVWFFSALIQFLPTWILHIRSKFDLVVCLLALFRKKNRASQHPHSTGCITFFQRSSSSLSEVKSISGSITPFVKRQRTKTMMPKKPRMVLKEQEAFVCFFRQRLSGLTKFDVLSYMYIYYLPSLQPLNRILERRASTSSQDHESRGEKRPIVFN